ncbi:MAG TPA: hypothetical protein V6C72_14410 [Chroococcales cyanobacterium]
MPPENDPAKSNWLNNLLSPFRQGGRAARKKAAELNQPGAAKAQEPENSQHAPQPEEPAELCCQGSVHIAYRGVSDDRLYLASNRKWSEVKFFRPNGLRVFCSQCRRRLL